MTIASEKGASHLDPDHAPARSWGGKGRGGAPLRDIADVGGDPGERQRAMPPLEIAMLISKSDFQISENTHRETVHDLRNLFAVIVSARRLLSKDCASEQGQRLLAAIEDAAFRGSQLTTNLLAREFAVSSTSTDRPADVSASDARGRAPSSAAGKPAAVFVCGASVITPIPAVLAGL